MILCQILKEAKFLYSEENLEHKSSTTWRQNTPPIFKYKHIFLLLIIFFKYLDSLLNTDDSVDAFVYIQKIKLKIKHKQNVSGQRHGTERGLLRETKQRKLKSSHRT